MTMAGYNEPPYKYNHISTNTTTVVKSGPGILHTVVVNLIGTAPATLVLWDNTAASGTQIANITLNANDTFFLYDIGFNIGLTAVTTSGATVSDYTISYS